MNKTTTEYVMRMPKSNDDLWIKNVGPVPDPNEIRIVFRDGTFATFKDAGSLQEFLDKVARYHELEKDLEIARKALKYKGLAIAGLIRLLRMKAPTFRELNDIERLYERILANIKQIEHKD